MVSRKASGTERGDGRAAAKRRARGHTLAPAHLGEAGSVIMLAMGVLGMAVFIWGVALIAGGLTMAGRFTGTTPPPNLDTLGVGQVLGGLGLVALGVLQAGGALALLAGVRGSRLLAMLVALVSAALSLAGVVIVMQHQTAVPLLTATLGVAALLYAASAIVLARFRP